jgi:hypothetical protein
MPTDPNTQLCTPNGLGPLHPRASRIHPPAEQTRLVPLRQPRSMVQRAAASISVFVLGQSVGAWYLRTAELQAPDLVFKAIGLLTWLGPVVAWFALRHRHLGDRSIQGHPLNVLAEMSAGLSERWITLEIESEDVVHDIEDELLQPGQTARIVEVVASEDLIVDFGPVYVRGKGNASADAGTASQACRAIQVLLAALTRELGLFTHQVQPLYASPSEDIETEIGAHIDEMSFVIKHGQRQDTDEVCAAVLRAVDALRMQFDLKPGES